MNATRAFAPGSISLLFKVVPHKNPSQMGSLGVGFTVSEGITATVKKSDTPRVLWNGHVIDLPTVSRTASLLTKEIIEIRLVSTLPLGSGFGLSGASALASALAVNTLLALNKSRLELAKIAHRAEVENKTGLGDVTNQYFGGFFVKFVSSARFAVQKLPVKPIPVYCTSYGPLLTSSVLSNTSLVTKINREADIALGQIKKILKTSSRLSFGRISSIANAFTKNAGLVTPQVERQIARIKRGGGNASMILLGNAVVSDIPFPGSRRLSMGNKKAITL